MNSDDLRKLMQQKMSTSPSLRSLIKRIQSDKATFRDTAEYSRIYSELLGKCLSDNVLSLDDREAAAVDMLRESYGHTTSILSQVQTNIDKKNGINLRPRAAAFPLERVTQFSHSLVDPTVEDSVIKRRARSGSANISMSYHDNYMETNAEFRHNAGLKCYITRETDGKCCKWCTAIAGRYVYGEEPHDVYRRHDNCGCSVIYENGRQRQDVWSKRTWEKPKVGAGAPPPTKFTPEQARGLEQEKLRNIHGLSIDIILNTEYNLYRKTKNTGDFSGLSEPMQMRHIHSVLRELGVDTKGIEFDIIRDKDLIGKGVYGYTFPNGRKVQLYPDAFSSREELVKTLGHERIHCNQIRLFGEAKTIDELREYERAAKFSEDYWWSIYKERTGYYESK